MKQTQTSGYIYNFTLKKLLRPFQTQIQDLGTSHSSNHSKTAGILPDKVKAKPLKFHMTEGNFEAKQSDLS